MKNRIYKYIEILLNAFGSNIEITNVHKKELIAKRIKDDYFYQTEELKARNEEIKEYSRLLSTKNKELQGLYDYVNNIFKSMTDTLIVVNPDATIKTVNHATLNLLGYRESELIGKPINMIFAEEEELFKRSGIEDLIKKGFITGVEKTYLSKDGRKIPALFSGSVMRNNEGNVDGIVCIALDITEHKTMIEKINNLSKFSEEIPLAALRVAKDGTIMYANPASSPILNFWGLSTGQRLPESFRQLILDVLDSGLHQEITVYCENKLFSLRLTPIVAAEYVNIYGDDITEREKGAAALCESERNYRSLIEAIPDIVYRVNVYGNFTFISHSIMSLGYEPKELIGKHFRSILKGNVESVDRSLILPKYAGKSIGGKNTPKLFDERRTGKRMTRNLEVHLAPKKQGSAKTDGAEFVGLITAFGEVAATGNYDIKKDEGAKFIGTVGIIRDVTEKINLQQEAIRAGQLATLGELAASVAHEINNPINGVIVCAQLLLDKFISKNIDYDLVNKIIAQSDRITDVAKSLLSFARDEGNDRSYFNIKELLSEVLTLTGMQIKKDMINLKVNIPPDLLEIIVYPQRIQQVFFNILSNARFALNEKYPKAHKDKIIEITGKMAAIYNNTSLQITFYDNGTGIAADKVNKVMDAFFTTKPRGQGTGLGLSICNNIINDHGGKIEIDSAEGKYTNVIINLPVTEDVIS